jgi:glycosyltransferase involved in cell wall biosynthesis
VTRFSAYTPAYNVSEYLARTIEGLLLQARPFDEILVIDDGSRDNSAEIASRYPQVTLIKHPVNKDWPRLETRRCVPLVTNWWLPWTPMWLPIRTGLPRSFRI